MGNCVHKPVTWLDDDDDDIVGGEPWTPPGRYYQENIKLLHGRQKSRDEVFSYLDYKSRGEEKIMKVPSDVPAAAATATEIKIRISRKQLEELLQNFDGSSTTLEKVLLDLVSLGEASGLQEHGRHWRPNLQSIPEGTE